ncbi:hypothetical protein [Nodularia sp. UHCC 0506]|uniref:hypothetical protein n=1 Tax=Nodularia sp. UHCC 0506 TaxID=3110243 RepID=UPI002B1F3900|nr:hypothetical protein [Nodularia sp. UHCC 0506]MEA5517023.1 hypothetical protein [Nodularia sp. UHCC 0506]
MRIYKYLKFMSKNNFSAIEYNYIQLNPYDNRKPGSKLTEVIDLAALVPDGPMG